MAVATRSSGSSNFGGITNAPSIASVAAQTGDWIYYCVIWRGTGGGGGTNVVISGTPSWNSLSMTKIGSTLSLNSDTGLLQMVVYCVKATSNATATITAAFDQYANAVGGYAVVSGADGTTPNGTPVTQNIWSSYSAPSSSVGSVGANDYVLEFLGEMGWDSSFNDTSAGTWSAASSQTSLFNQAFSTDTGGAPQLVAATKTGSGSVTVGYTFSSGSPGYLHWSTRIISAAAAATLSSATPSGTLSTTTTATIGATTDISSGTAYAVLDQTQTNVTTATDANVKAGQIAGGGAAQGSGSAAVSSTSISIPVTSLGAGVLYYYSEIQNSAGGDSNRLSGSFTTLAVTNYTENQTATATVTTSTSGTVTFANAPVLGELIVVTIAQNSSTVTITPPAGFTQKATINPTSRRLSTYWKIAGGSESTSYTFTFSGSVSAGMCARRVSPQAGYGWSATQNGVDISTSSDSAVSSVTTTGGSSNIGNLYVAVAYSANTTASNKELLPNYSWSSNNLLYSSRSRHAIRPTSGVNQIFGYNLTDAATDTRNAFLMSEFLQYATSPAISSIDDATPNYLGAIVITGNASALPFPTSQSGSAGVTIDGVAQVVTWNTTTSCSIASIARGASKYGTNISVILTDASGNASPAYTTTLSPQAGWNYVDTSGTLVTSGDRITASPDLASGDQITWGNVVGGTIADVTVYADGSFTWNPGVTAFDVSINDGTGFSAAVTQHISYPSPMITRGSTRVSKWLGSRATGTK